MEGKSFSIQKNFQLQQNFRSPLYGYLFVDNVNAEGTMISSQSKDIVFTVLYQCGNVQAVILG